MSLPSRGLPQSTSIVTLPLTAAGAVTLIWNVPHWGPDPPALVVNPFATTRLLESRRRQFTVLSNVRETPLTVKVRATSVPGRGAYTAMSSLTASGWPPMSTTTRSGESSTNTRQGRASSSSMPKPTPGRPLPVPSGYAETLRVGVFPTSLYGQQWNASPGFCGQYASGSSSRRTYLPGSCSFALRPASSFAVNAGTENGGFWPVGLSSTTNRPRPGVTSSTDARQSTTSAASSPSRLISGLFTS